VDEEAEIHFVRFVFCIYPLYSLHMFMRVLMMIFFGVVIGLTGDASFVRAEIGGPCTPPRSGYICADTFGWEATRITSECTGDVALCPGTTARARCCRGAGATETTPPGTEPTRPSNTQGLKGASTAATLSQSSGNCTFNGVHDPFCGKSIAEIIGNAVRFLLGAAGALFLAMFVYGGAVWLTAGASDRHEEARKTLLNATAGILIIIASYTIVSLLVRFAGGLGASQTNQAPRFEESGQEGALTPAGATGAAGACNAERFVTACHEECRTSLVVGVAGQREACTAACGSYGPRICQAVRTPSDCGPGCSTLCASSEVPEIARGFCSSECGDLCAAAFR